MAASSDNGSSATETLNPSNDNHQPSITSLNNGQDSTNQSHNLSPLEPAESQLSDPQPTDGNAKPSEKRKRDETEEQEDQDSKSSSLHPLWKTSLCSYFRGKLGICSHGSACRYAHGEEELRPRPDKTWDPTSERAKKIQKSEDGESVDVSPGSEILMTEAFVDDDDNNGSDTALSKCLVHLPRNWNSENLKSFLDEQGVLFKLARKKKGMTIGFMTFESIEQAKGATEELNGKSVGNKSLKVADVVPRSIEKKKVNSALASNVVDDGDRIEDGLTVDGSASKGRSARDVVTPLAHMPYKDQLEHKKNSLMQILKKLTRNARKACPSGISIPEWILKSREIGGLPCKLEGIIGSPLVNGYRNKCEFSIGYSLQGKPTVGFMLGNFREGVTAVEEPVDCPNVSSVACKYASILQDFLQCSSLPVWNRFNNTGFWRQLTVREGRKPEKADEVENCEANISEVMLMVQVCTVGIDDEITNGEFGRMAQVFAAGATANSLPLPLTAVVVQDHQGISNVAPADAPLHSIPIPKVGSGCALDVANNLVEARIHDYISNLRFCISPTAFFQVNTLAAEKLYSLAGDWASLGPDTLLFDICCGTGTIGLTLAHHVGMVVGIELNASAVSDAYRNAEINGIKNCRFVCAKAEDVMDSLLKRYLNVAHKCEKILDAFESNDKETIITEKKHISMDNVLEPEESSSHGNDASGCSENGKQDSKNPLQKGCIAEGGDTSLQQFRNVVAIVDPPRAGLHPTVIKALRTHPRLRRLVYISCNPESLVANAIELCTPSATNTEKGNKNHWGWRNMSSTGLARHRAKSMPNSDPFRPVRAMAVDLFPHTPHCEMVMLLERGSRS